MNESFDSLSVIELRKIAKEKGIKLGAGINKQGIIDKLKAAQEAEEPTAAPVQLSLEEPAPAPTAETLEDGTVRLVTIRNGEP